MNWNEFWKRGLAVAGAAFAIGTIMSFALNVRWSTSLGIVLAVTAAAFARSEFRRQGISSRLLSPVLTAMLLLAMIPIIKGEIAYRAKRTHEALERRQLAADLGVSRLVEPKAIDGEVALERHRQERAQDLGHRYAVQLANIRHELKVGILTPNRAARRERVHTLWYNREARNLWESRVEEPSPYLARWRGNVSGITASIKAMLAARRSAPSSTPGAETPVAKVVEVHRGDLVITPGGCLPLDGGAFDIQNRRVKFYPSDDQVPRRYELGDLQGGKFAARHSITVPKEKLPAVLPGAFLRICFPEGLHGGHLEIGWNR